MRTTRIGAYIAIMMIPLILACGPRGEPEFGTMLRDGEGKIIGRWVEGTTAEIDGEAIDVSNGPVIRYDGERCDGVAAVYTGVPLGRATAVLGARGEVFVVMRRDARVNPRRPGSISRLMNGEIRCWPDTLHFDVEEWALWPTGRYVTPVAADDLSLTF